MTCLWHCVERIAVALTAEGRVCGIVGDGCWCGIGAATTTSEASSVASLCSVTSWLEVAIASTASTATTFTSSTSTSTTTSDLSCWFLEGIVDVENLLLSSALTLTSCLGLAYEVVLILLLLC